jgi:hypothetical protein
VPQLAAEAERVQEEGVLQPQDGYSLTSSLARSLARSPLLSLTSCPCFSLFLSDRDTQDGYQEQGLNGGAQASH